MITVRTTIELLDYFHGVFNHDAEPDDEWYFSVADLPGEMKVPLVELAKVEKRGAFKFCPHDEMPECWGVDLDDERLQPLLDWKIETELGVYFHANMVIFVVYNSDHWGGYVPNYFYGWAAE